MLSDQQGIGEQDEKVHSRIRQQQEQTKADQAESASQMAEKRTEIEELVAQISSEDQLEETHANWEKLMQVAAEVERLQEDIELTSAAPGQLKALRAREEELKAQKHSL